MSGFSASDAFSSAEVVSLGASTSGAWAMDEDLTWA